MSESPIDRRTALLLGGAALAASLIGQDAVAATSNAVLLLDPTLPGARVLARRSRGRRIVEVRGDLVRLWRGQLGAGPARVEGFTSWSDYLLLRELAAEDGLRIRSETHERSPGAPLTVRWTAA